MLNKIKYLLSFVFVLILVSCSAGPSYDYDKNEYGEEYQGLIERGFVDPKDNPLSNFKLDSSSYAYTNLRRLINNNQYIPDDAVVIEQMLNYFNYSYKNNSDDALSTFIEVTKCPWNDENYIALISVNAHEIEYSQTNNNFVFLVDTSGSMSSNNKLPLFQEGFKMFAENLTENDTISIVTYASGVRVIADGINGNEKDKLIDAVDELSASGSTNGSGGIQKAYQIALKNFIVGGNNRIMLVTDGDFNVGINDQDSLNEFISEKRQTGVYLSVLGFGIGNTKHNTMETLAQNGNGNSYYVDSLLECQKLFVEEIGTVLHTVAKDAKIQVEFNPNVVNKYRLLGYENKMMSESEFEDNETDSGEIGMGHTTIAMYEINLKEEINEYILKTELRYKVPETEEVKEILKSVSNVSEHSDDTLFASAVVEFALILRNSRYKANSSYEHLFTYIYDINTLEDYYKEDFIKLVEQAYNNESLNKNRYD